MCKADNLPPSCAVVTNSGKLNFLEPSGPVQTCNGTALPLPCLYTFTEILSVIFLVLRRWTSYGASCNVYSDALFMVQNVPQKELYMTEQCCDAVVACSFSLDMCDKQ